MKNNNIFKLVIAIFVSELAGIIGSIFTTPSIDGWYRGLIKPALNPPAWVFAPVWTTLFVFMGIAAFLVWSSYTKVTDRQKKKGIKIALILFGIQLVLNILWSVIFFGLHIPGVAFIEIIFLWLAILVTIVAFAKISKLAGWFLVPYIFWVSFAGYLNYSIWHINAGVSMDSEQVATKGVVENFGNDQIEGAITNYLLTQKHFSWKTRENSHNFCVIENLKPEKELFPLYLWSYCGEYIIEDNELKTISGSSGPVKIDYPNELSFYDLNKFSYEAPGDGSNYAEDIRRIFPEDIWQHIFDFDRENIIKRIKSIAFTNISSWALIKQAINNCEVERVWQTHDRTVKAELKNGEELSAVEPVIDDIINIVEAIEFKCGKILMGTE